MTVDVDEIRRAAKELESGGLVAFPTETVYGLGADAENPEAVAKIYALKGRPADHPVIVHLAPEADVSYWVSDFPEMAQRLVHAFWPGPLTLILPRATHIPDAVSGGQTTIGLRCPSHPVAQALLRAFRDGRGGIAAPSANRFGHVSPTIAQHVRDEFRGDSRLEIILEGGQSEIGIESTILDMSRLATHGAVLLRPGQISVQEIAQVTGQMPSQPDVSAPRASGTLEAHYAPHTPVALVQTQEMPGLLQRLKQAGKRVALMHYSPMPPADLVVKQRLLAELAAGYAHDLYAALRALDEAGADMILIESPPTTDEWQGVNDRLRRAVHDSVGVLSS